MHMSRLFFRFPSRRTIFHAWDFFSRRPRGFRRIFLQSLRGWHLRKLLKMIGNGDVFVFFLLIRIKLFKFAHYFHGIVYDA